MLLISSPFWYKSFFFSSKHLGKAHQKILGIVLNQGLDVVWANNGLSNI